jgi:hypothetical protein
MRTENFSSTTSQILRNVRKAKRLQTHSMMFRAVFWNVLPCKVIVDRLFRGAYCLHHQG